MNDIFGFRDGQPVVWFHKNLEKSNKCCPYCGAYVGPSSEMASDKEHLIAREFVPKGFLAESGFNFIFRACRVCNGEKAEAERHVSSVTLFDSPAREVDSLVDEVATHKASRDYHPKKKGVLVKDAGDSFTIKLGEGGIKMEVGYVGPPQLDPDAVHLLASYHVQGMFNLLETSNPKVLEESRVLPSSYIYIGGFYGHRDWGNAHLREILRRVKNWWRWADIVTAKGHFKFSLKESDDPGEGCFWALEWNKSLRVVGAVCDPACEPKLFKDLPDLGWRYVPGGRKRREVPLSEEEDDLFIRSSAEDHRDAAADSAP